MRPASGRRAAFGRQVQEAVIFLPQVLGRLVMQEGYEAIAGATQNRARLMQQRAGEYHGRARRRPERIASEFRKDQLAAFIVAVEIDGDGKTAMGGALGGVVAVGAEMAAIAFALAGPQHQMGVALTIGLVLTAAGAISSALRRFER